MARGWESKAVESQVDSAAAAKMARIGERKTQDQIEKDSRRGSLMLSRTRVLHDLETACNPRYRQQLQLALAHLDRQIADLG
jgi:hypothetical protein